MYTLEVNDIIMSNLSSFNKLFEMTGGNFKGIEKVFM